MGKIFECTVTYGRTVNIGNFESLRIDVSAGMKISPGEDHQEVLEACKRKVKNEAEKFISSELRTINKAKDYF